MNHDLPALSRVGRGYGKKLTAFFFKPHGGILPSLAGAKGPTSHSIQNIQLHAGRGLPHDLWRSFRCESIFSPAPPVKIRGSGGSSWRVPFPSVRIRRSARAPILPSHFRGGTLSMTTVSDPELSLDLSRLCRTPRREIKQPGRRSSVSATRRSAGSSAASSTGRCDRFTTPRTSPAT